MVLGQDFREIGAQIVRKFMLENNMLKSVEIFDLEWQESRQDSKSRNRGLEMLQEMSLPDLSLLSLVDSYLSTPFTVPVEDLTSTCVKLLEHQAFETAGKITCCDSTHNQVLVGHASGHVDLYNTSGEFRLSFPKQKSPVLSVLIHNNWRIFTTMDGRCAIYDSTGSEIQILENHTKYCTRALVIENFLVTISHDKSIVIYQQIDKAFHLIERIVHGGIIECMDVVENTLIYAVRGDYRVHQIDFPTLEKSTINLNTNGDSYASFNVLDIALKKDYITVYTDSKAGRIIIYKNGQFLTNLWGSTVDEFSKPRLKWYKDAIVCSSELQVLVFGMNGQVAQRIDFNDIVRGLFINNDMVGAATANGKVQIFKQQ